MTLKRRKKENDSAGHGNDEYSESTCAATPDVQEFSERWLGGALLKVRKKKIQIRSGRTMQILEKMDNSKKTHFICDSE